MNRIVYAALGLFLLRDCNLTGPAPGTVILGTWGGENAGLIADDTSGHLHIGCTFGDIHQAIVIGPGGGFNVPGDYVLRAYPVYVGPTLPATFNGTVAGRVMTLSVAVNDTTADTVAHLGPVKLTLGAEPQMGPCPICFGKRATRPRPGSLTLVPRDP